MLHINSILGLGLGRRAFIVVGGDGSDAKPWTALALSGSDTAVPIRDSDSPAAVFAFDTPALPPPSFTPTGDRVRVRPNANQFDTFPGPATSALTNDASVVGITWAWASSSALGPAPFVLLYVAQSDGTPEQWIFAVPDELELITPNPAFG